jgi:2-dehydropantoate 2-reductase
MHFTVVGPGALGCLFAAMLARAQHTVWSLDHDEKRAAYLQDHGINLELDGAQLQVPVNATADPAVVEQSDVVLLCVKSQDVETALLRFKPFLTSEILLIALQNGIGHHELLQQAAQLYAVGITAQGGTLAGVGKIIHGGSGQTVLGYLPKASNKKFTLLQRVAKVFKAADLPAIVSESIIDSVWDKLVINVGINALTAIHNCRNGELLADPLIVREQQAAVKEAANVAMAKGIALAGDPVEITENVCQATSYNVSSMLQDIRKGRRTEIDAINGAIVKEGKVLGIPTPVNERLVAAVKALEPTVS